LAGGVAAAPATLNQAVSAVAIAKKLAPVPPWIDWW